ncbi:MAG: aldo/keto reductase [Acidobacteriota bacterium]|nr:MAG: aldo/keto reductase [Acidobacteriota bacterium]
MTRRHLGNSDLEISPLGLGTWALGGDSAFGWGPQDDRDSISAIRRAFEKGINWLDTAPIYGLGHAERIVGRALRDIGTAQRPLIFTKCGLVWDEVDRSFHSLKAESIRREVEASLSRLMIDVIDLYQIHWPSFPPGTPDDDLEEAWAELSALIEQGKVRHIGVSNFDVSQLERVRAIAPVTSLQPPYSMLMREIETELLPFCRANGIGVIVYSPMHGGLLSGKMTRERFALLPESDWRKRGNPAFREPQLTQNLKFVELLRDIGGHHGHSPAEVAIAWTLRDPVVTGAIVGARRAEQVDGFLAALEFRLSPSEIERIQKYLPKSVGILDFS